MPTTNLGPLLINARARNPHALQRAPPRYEESIMHDENQSNEQPRYKRMLEELHHPYPWQRIFIVVAVTAAFLASAVLAACEP